MFLVAKSDRLVYDHIKKNLCECEYTKTKAFTFTNNIIKDKLIEHIKDE